MREDTVEQLCDSAVPGKPHRGVHRFGIYPVSRGTLVKKTQRVAHTAVGKPRDKLCRVAGHVKMLLPGHILKMVREGRAVNALEAVALAAGKYGRGDLLQLGSREDEHQMLRRLL